jgi:hypothetical protein
MAVLQSRAVDHNVRRRDPHPIFAVAAVRVRTVVRARHNGSFEITAKVADCMALRGALGVAGEDRGEITILARRP